MDSSQKIEDLERIAAETVIDDSDAVEESGSVEDFIRQLEEKEKDLHITADTTIIELAEGFEDTELPEYLKAEFEPVTHKSISPLAHEPASSETSEVVEELEHEVEDLEGEVAGLEMEVAGLREQLAQMEVEREEIFQNSQRRAKDFENYKARTHREREETYEAQIGSLATQMLPALDNLDRAVDFASVMPKDDPKSVQQFFEGIVLVNRQLKDVLEDMGIRSIKTVGQPFDPQFHEAVETEETTEFPANTICGELLRGYRVGNRVIRHSMVKVAMSPGNGDDRTAESDIDAVAETPAEMSRQEQEGSED